MQADGLNDTRILQYVFTVYTSRSNLTHSYSQQHTPVRSDPCHPAYSFFTTPTAATYSKT